MQEGSYFSQSDICIAFYIDIFHSKLIERHFTYYVKIAKSILKCPEFVETGRNSAASKFLFEFIWRRAHNIVWISCLRVRLRIYTQGNIPIAS